MVVAGAAAVEAAPKKRRDAGLDKKMRGVVKGGLGRCPPVPKKERPHRTGSFEQGPFSEQKAPGFAYSKSWRSVQSRIWPFLSWVGTQGLARGIGKEKWF